MSGGEGKGGKGRGGYICVVCEGLSKSRDVRRKRRRGMSVSEGV